MSSIAVAEKRAQASAACQILARVPGVTSVALFGSVARGDAKPQSDIDLIVLGTSEDLTSSGLRHQLPFELSDADISISYYTPESLDDYLRRWSRFGAHLRLEGRILHDTDGRLEGILAEERPISTDHEFATQRQHLQRYEHVDRFGGRLLFPLAHLYRIGRAAAFAAIAKTGHLEFDRREAFQLAVMLYPHLEPEFAAITELDPFYELVRAPDFSIDLPFEPIGSEAERRFVHARDCVARVVSIGDSA